MKFASKPSFPFLKTKDGHGETIPRNFNVLIKGTILLLLLLLFSLLLVTTEADNYTSDTSSTNATLPTYNVQLSCSK